jgi:DNA polymerase IV
VTIACLRFPDVYAAIEQRDAPEHAGRPLIVGGDPAKGGTVLSASPQARALGIETGMEVARAQQQCPALLRRATNLPRYREVIEAIRARVRDAHERSEPIGLEGCYVDHGTDARAEQRTAELAARIRAEQRISVQAGLGPSCFVAYLAACAAGAEQGVRAIAPAAALDFLGGHPVTVLWGLGPSAAEKLAQHGVRTIAQLRELGAPALEEIVGARNALTFLAHARGADRSTIPPRERRKSLSRERTLRPPQLDRRALDEEIAGLARDLEELLERERAEARTVRLDLTHADGEHVTRSSTSGWLRRHDEIAEAARDLLERTHAGLRPVLKLRLQLARLRAAPEPSPRQLRLF